PMTCQVGPGLGSACMAVTDVPVICQSASAPLSFCHRMSASRLPVVPSKSAAALTCQSGVTTGSAATLLGVLLFMIQTTSSPAWSRQRRSPLKVLPSEEKLKSERRKSVIVVIAIFPLGWFVVLAARPETAAAQAALQCKQRESGNAELPDGVFAASRP